jgi:hypothetical protein
LPGPMGWVGRPMCSNKHFQLVDESGVWSGLTPTHPLEMARPLVGRKEQHEQT